MTTAVGRRGTLASTRPVGSEGVLASVAAAHKQRKTRDRIMVWSGIAAVGIGALLFWEYGLELIVNQRYVSQPSDILRRLVEMASEPGGMLWRNIAATMIEAGSGYLIGVVIGLLGALMLSFSRRAYEVLEPFLMAFYSIPKIALAPLFVMWFGLGYTPKVILAALMVFFIVFMNTVAGVRSINPDLINVTRVLGAGRWAMMSKILFPAASPAIMASVRITFSRAMVGAILAEFIAATQGLGYMISRSSDQFDTPAVFAGILVIAILVMAVNGLIRWTEARLLPWNVQGVRG